MSVNCILVMCCFSFAFGVQTFRLAVSRFPIGSVLAGVVNGLQIMVHCLKRLRVFIQFALNHFETLDIFAVDELFVQVYRYLAERLRESSH